MGNEFGEGLELITFFNFETGDYDLKQMPKEFPMPRAGSKVYENREGLLFAIGRENGKSYMDLLRVSDFNSNIVYDWVPLKNSKIINSLSKLNGINYFEDEELDFGDDENSKDNENFFQKSFQGAD